MNRYFLITFLSDNSYDERIIITENNSFPNRTELVNKITSETSHPWSVGSDPKSQLVILNIFEFKNESDYKVFIF